MELQSKEIESAILGICLLEKTAFGRTYNLIDEHCFYSSDNQKIYAILREMYDENLPIDLLTVFDKINRKNISFNAENIAWYLTVLTNHVTASTHLEYHCWILKDLWRRRELLKLTQSGIDGSEDVKKQINTLNSQITNIQGSDFKKDWYAMDELIFNLVKHQDEILSGEKEFITTGFKAIDKENGGFGAGNLIILGARPTVGKSAIMGKIAMAQAMQNKKVGIISLEMNNIEIAARLSSLETDIDFSTIYRNLFADENQRSRFYNIVNNRLSTLPIFVSDKTKVDINEIKAKAAKLKHWQGIDCLMIDYLQLVDTSEYKNSIREQEVAKLSRGLKMLAMDMEIPVIALCQLNRAVTQRKGNSRYPQLSDLRESGSLEQDADIVMMLHRDWLIEGHQEDASGNSTEFKADLLVQKWRNGATCHLELEFEPTKMRFKEQQVLKFIPREQEKDTEETPF